ncbi:MAG: DNA repair protein radA [Desulfotomaculum sp. 46_296]|nr:MAG: DNA repair protein radA [Desulfotomaculum sp. 46_296]HAU31406.1 DNA repair protein RadA [Desulfotomaculum sp.]
MAVKTTFYCQECGYQSHRWLGRCPGCSSWNTLLEEPGPAAANSAVLPGALPVIISEIQTEAEERFSSGIEELDRVLGGGIVNASVVLLGGDPGIGKSTLLLQAAERVSNSGRRVLYASGEESVQQIQLRAQRLKATGRELYLVFETDINRLEQHIIDLAPALVVVDSIQTVFKSEISSAPGSVGQVRECTMQLMRLAKDKGVSIFIVGHVTKEGVLAGPRLLEHIVDTVLYFEGERHQFYRILRACKNRFGSTNEIGVFEMCGDGLTEVNNPSAFFMMNYHKAPLPGTVVVPVLEGTRPLLVEIQALVAPAAFGAPRRMTAGVDYNRVVLLAAVLEKRAGLPLAGYDIYVKAVGGVHLDEPAVDLGIALAIASSYRDRAVDPSLVTIGEVALTGEIRPVSGISKRINEAVKLGFTKCLAPLNNASLINEPGMIITGVETMSEAMETALGV